MHSNKNACVVANPGEQEMQDLIQKAHINILPALNSTGVKLKLLNALFVGRYCISNPTGAASSGVGECCEILTDNADMILKLINSYRSDEFTAAKIADREAVLMRIYNNEENCRKLIEWIW